MKWYAIYSPDGCIQALSQGDYVDVAGFKSEGFDLYELNGHIDINKWYIDVSKPIFFPRRRHDFDTSHTSDGLTVTFDNLPPGTTVRVLGNKMVTHDGVAELEFDVPGTYSVEFEHFQYLDTVVEVTVE